MNAPVDTDRLLLEQQAIFDNAAVGIVLSRDHLIVRCNQRAAEILGYSVEELVGQESSSLYFSDSDYAMLRRRVVAALDARRSFIGDCTFRRREGIPVCCRLSARQIDAGDIAQGVIWTFEDITEHERARADLQRAKRELEVIFDSAVLGITLVRNRLIQRCNSRFEEIFGYASGELEGKSTRCWYRSDEEYAGVGADAYSSLHEDNYHRREQIFVRKDGSTFLGQIAGRALDPACPQEGSVWLVEDISERKRMARQLELANRVFEHSSEGIIVTDAENNIISANRAAQAMTGYTFGDLIGRNPRLFQSGRHDKTFYTGMWQRLGETDHWSGEIWDRRKDGSVYPKLMHVDVVRDAASGAVVNYLAVFSDITDQKAAEALVQHQAHHDALTGLANRTLLGIHLDHALARARREKDRLAVLFVDLDQFKPVNDQHGHAVGDRLLSQVAERMRGAIRESDMIARVGGDEFVIVIEGQRNPDDLPTFAEKLIANISRPYNVDGRCLQVGCSIGIAHFPEHGESTAELLATADAAMYVSKASGRGRFAIAEV